MYKTNRKLMEERECYSSNKKNQNENRTSLVMINGVNELKTYAWEKNR